MYHRLWTIALGFVKPLLQDCELQASCKFNFADITVNFLFCRMKNMLASELSTAPTVKIARFLSNVNSLSSFIQS